MKKILKVKLFNLLHVLTYDEQDFLLVERYYFQYIILVRSSVEYFFLYYSFTGG